MILFRSLWLSSSSSYESSFGDYFEGEDMRADDVEDSLSSKSNEKFWVSLIFSILLLVFDVVVHLTTRRYFARKYRVRFFFKSIARIWCGTSSYYEFSYESFFKDFLGEYVEWEILYVFDVVDPLTIRMRFYTKVSLVSMSNEKFYMCLTW